MNFWKLKYSKIAAIIALTGTGMLRLILKADINYETQLILLSQILRSAGFILSVLGLFKIGYEKKLKPLTNSCATAIVGLILINVAPYITPLNTVITGDITIMSIVSVLGLYITGLGFIFMGIQIIKLDKFNNKSTKSFGVLNIVYGAFNITIVLITLNFVYFIVLVISYIYFFTEKEEKPLKHIKPLL